MAANKFATMLHRKTNKLTLILIYAILEWTLIILLLLNSLFSYMIIKFAEYFGLKPPCLWCSRVGHFFEPGEKKNMQRDLLCEVHAAEISKIGYCSNHRKLAESQDMCEDCSSSQPDYCGTIPKNLTMYPWMKQVGLIENGGDNVGENCEVSMKCSCCGVSLDDKLYPPYIVIKPSWDVLDYTQKRDLITEAGDDDDHADESDSSDKSRSAFGAKLSEDEHGIENRGENQTLSDVNGGKDVREEEAEEDSSISEYGEFKVGVAVEGEKDIEKKDDSGIIKEGPSIHVCSREDATPEILPQHLEFFIDCSGHQLVPIELIDWATEEDQMEERVKEEDQENTDHQEASSGSQLHHLRKQGSVEGTKLVLSGHEHEVQPKFSVLESMEIEEDENCVVFHAKEFHPVKQTPSEDVDNVQAMSATEEGEGEEEDNPDVPPVSEEVPQMPVNETETDVSIGTEIPDLDSTDEVQTHEPLSSDACTNEDPSTSSATLLAENDHGSKKAQEETVEFRTLSVEVTKPAINNPLSWPSELNETEEERVPDTPTSIDSLHNLHKKLLLLEKKESGTEESLDGSVISELEGGEGVVTVEHLKSALRSERKALQSLYVELEEERSASAVAANQTMAMINRLQEEKAAMQMEALQYQRMMEEQSEYDQEALQLLNELMVKREKEKQELEKELEVYRKKALDYESKEKTRMLRKSKDGSTRSGFSSSSYSNVEDSDDLSIDLNQEAKEEDGFYDHQETGNHNTPVDAVLNLEESLADFEEERMSILEQLKALEQKLFTLDDEEDQQFEDVRPVGHIHEENGNHLDGNPDFGDEEKGVANGFAKDMNGKHHQERRIVGSKGKKLLPLFDAMSTENGEVVLINGHENGYDFDNLHESTLTKSELDEKKLEIEEEVDHLYERLQALEADREFLKHCISSLKKGDKGMDLLQEILQHLRDLRNVELRVRNLGDGVLV